MTDVTHVWLLQALATAAVRIVPQCNAAALKNLMWALGTAGFYHEQLLKAIEPQLLSQSPYLGLVSPFIPQLVMPLWHFCQDKILLMMLETVGDL